MKCLYKKLLKSIFSWTQFNLILCVLLATLWKEIFLIKILSYFYRGCRGWVLKGTWLLGTNILGCRFDPQLMPSIFNPGL